MCNKSTKDKAKELIDKLSVDKAKLILNLLERFNEKEEQEKIRGKG